MKIAIYNKGVGPFSYLPVRTLSTAQNKETYNRTPHPTDMKYAVASRGPPVRIIKTGGVFTTEPFVFENCRDFQTEQAKNTFAICNVAAGKPTLTKQM